MSTIPVQAQNIQAIESSTIGAQVEYNNQWGQSFEATGPNIQGGGPGGSIFPFANVYTPGEAIQGENQNALDMDHLGAEGDHIDHDHEHIQTSPLVVQPIIVPNSGRATFTASVTDLTLHGGTLMGEGEIVASSSSSNIILNQDPVDGVPSINFNPRIGEIEELESLTDEPTESAIDDNDTLAANILGTNIGVDVIQVTGTNSYTVVNTLSAF